MHWSSTCEALEASFRYLFHISYTYLLFVITHTVMHQETLLHSIVLARHDCHPAHPMPVTTVSQSLLLILDCRERILHVPFVIFQQLLIHLAQLRISKSNIEVLQNTTEL